MKLYADYIKERENAELVYDDNGFASYKKAAEGVIYIVNVYVKPSMRRSKVCNEYVNKIVNITNCEWVITSCDENANGWENSEKAIIGCGFDYRKKEGTLRWYSKEIK